MSEPSPGRSAPLWVFAILLGSYAFFWHSRDWNTSSRLMLTYALVDRGTIRIDGLHRQTGDEALVRGHFFSDKGPGFSILAAPPYWLARRLLGLPPHPTGGPPLKYWPADYWATLGTSGLATAALGALLAWLAARLGCGPRRSALVGLAYGLATPAFVYATLAYGHQVAALALLGSFALIETTSRMPGLKAAIRLGAAGFLAALAAVIELQVGPLAAILGIYVIARRLPLGSIVAFGVGAIGPTLLLLAYNAMAFGSPFDMGYFHHVIPEFRRVHGRGNPLGVGAPDLVRAWPLLWGGYRGLLYYAPIVLLAFPGWMVLAWRRHWGVAIVTASACAAVFLVNLGYPEWTGGWSTGPRLLVVLLPFAMLPVAALLAVGGRLTTTWAIVLALGGGALMLLFQGVGGRIPQDLADPLGQVVGPIWRGDPLPGWREGTRFEPTLVSVVWPAAAGHAWQFAPLVVFQIGAIAAMLAALRPPGRTAGPHPIAAG